MRSTVLSCRLGFYPRCSYWAHHASTKTYSPFFLTHSEQYGLVLSWPMNESQNVFDYCIFFSALIQNVTRISVVSVCKAFAFLPFSLPPSFSSLLPFYFLSLLSAPLLSFLPPFLPSISPLSNLSTFLAPNVLGIVLAEWDTMKNKITTTPDHTHSL